MNLKNVKVFLKIILLMKITQGKRYEHDSDL